LSCIVHVQRQQRLRILEALELEAKQFRTREELFPIRIPREPLRLDDVIERALGDEGRMFDLSTLRARTLLHLEWDDGSAWDAWVIMLPSQLRLFCDSVLSPLEDATGEYGDELLRSLETFIEQNGQWERAARELYCHRHTLRYRIRRVEQLTGRDLSSARDRIEFWLALRARELVT